MGKPSRDKGKRGEREVVNKLRDLGLDAYAVRQYRGGPDSPDVLIRNIKEVSIEVKRVQTYSVNQLRAWMAKATKDAEWRRLVALFHRRNHTDWMVEMSIEAYAELVKGME